MDLSVGFMLAMSAEFSVMVYNVTGSIPATILIIVILLQVAGAKVKKNKKSDRTAGKRS